MNESRILEDAVATATQALVGVSAAVADVVSAVAEDESRHSDEIYDLEMAASELEYEVRLNRDTEEWVGRVVREADGKAMDGLSPETILAWLLATLRAERGLHVPHTLVA